MKETKVLKNDKGITLLALIITIIVLLILVVVTINIGDNTKITSKAQKAVNDYDMAQRKESLIGYKLEYSQKTGKELSEEAINKLIEVSKKTGIDAQKFVIYPEKDGNTLVFYNWNKVTLDEAKKLEEIQISEEDKNNGYMYNRMLIADVDGDGFLTKEDSNKVQRIASMVESFQIDKDKANYYKTINNNKIPIADLNDDGIIDTIDSGTILSLRENTSNFKEYIMQNHGYYNR